MTVKQEPITGLHTPLLLGGSWVDWTAPLSRERVLAALPEGFNLRGVGLLKRRYHGYPPLTTIVAAGYYQTTENTPFGPVPTRREVLAFFRGKLPVIHDQSTDATMPAERRTNGADSIESGGADQISTKPPRGYGVGASPGDGLGKPNDEQVYHM